MTDISARLRNFASGCRGSMWQSRDETIQIMDEAADHIDAQAATIKALVEELTYIDALDPEGMVNCCSQSALTGLVLRMGEIARTALAAAKETT